MANSELIKKLIETVDAEMAPHYAAIREGEELKKSLLSRLEADTDHMNASGLIIRKASLAFAGVNTIAKKPTFSEVLKTIFNRTGQPMVISMIRDAYVRETGKKIKNINSFSGLMSGVVKNDPQLVKVVYNNFKQAEYKNWYGLNTWVANDAYITGHDQTIIDLQKRLTQNQLELK